MTALLSALIAPALVTPTHPPSGTKRGPTKAAPFLKLALAAKKKGDTKACEAALLEVKKILAQEGRFACCIKGGCAECALEGNCGCAANLFEKKGVCKGLSKIKSPQ